MKVRGQNLNGSTVKQTVENGQNISGDDDAASITSPVPAAGNKNSRLLGMVVNSTGPNRFPLAGRVQTDYS